VADVIELRALRLVTSVGVNPEERERPQPVELDLDVELEEGAGSDDDLTATVDYGALVGEIVKALDAEHVDLLERAAQLVADVVLAHPQAQAVTVVVRKLRPPVPFDMASSSVRITRRRGA
jgi:7,8-dihydroneopterin aldolase/epimerase/oxygenase